MTDNTQIPKKILKLINEIIKAEGGAKYTNDPKDRGGPTKFGITAKTLGHSRKLGRPATPAEVKALTKAEAISIYYKQYVLRPNFDEIENEAIQETVVDFGVNAGPGRAVKLLQRMINDIEGRKVLKVDGMLGHHSLELINEKTRMYPQLFRDSYGYLRIKYYIDITNKNPDNQKWIRGWTNRANKFISKNNRFDLQLLSNYVK